MAQTWTDDTFDIDHYGHDDLTHIEENLNTLQTTFSGVSEPPDAVDGTLWVNPLKLNIKYGGTSCEIFGVFSKTVPDLSVGTNAIQNGAITTSKLAAGSVDTDEILNGAIINSKIADGAVMFDKLGSGIWINGGLALVGSYTSVAAGDWLPVPVSEIIDPSNLVSISGGRFTIDVAGVYLVKMSVGIATGPTHESYGVRLYNHTAGSASRTWTYSSVNANKYISLRPTTMLTTSTPIELEVQVMGPTNGYCRFALCKLWKVGDA